MKKHILHLATALLFGASLFAASCGGDKTEGDGPSNPSTPNFPAKVTPTVWAGETYTLEMEPNGQWSLEFTNTTSETASWFWIQDGSQRVYSLRGSAGKRSIVIATKDEEDFDNSHSCELTLTIQDKQGKQSSQVVATITVDKFKRQILVYPCLLDEEGDFMFNPDPEANKLAYLYQETPKTEFELVWPVGRNGYSLPVMIKGNFDWAVRGELPDWLKDLKVASGTNGQQVEIRLEVKLEALPVEGADATIAIGDENETVSIKVKVPDSRELFSVDNFAEESVFNHEGHVFVASNGTYSEGPSAGNVTSAKDLKIFKLSFNDNGGYWDDENGIANWIEVKDKFEDTNVAQSRRIEVYAKPNAGDPRKGIVLGIPASLAAGITGAEHIADGANIKPEYQKYVITTIEQLAHPGPITAELTTNIESLEEVGTAFTKVSKNDELGWLFGEDLFANPPHVYKLLYTTGWGNDDWALGIADDAGVDYSKTIIYEEINDQFVKKTDPIWLKFDVSFKKITMGVPADTKKAGAIHLLNDASETVAVIYCILDKDAQLGDGGVEFQYPDAVQNAELAELTSGSYYDQYKDLGCRIYHLTYTGTGNTSNLKVPVYTTFSYANDSDKSWLTLEPSQGAILINMEPTGAKEGVLIFKNAGGGAVFVLVCTQKGAAQ